MASPIKLLVFSPYYPSHIGGLESHAQQFNERFSGDTHSITVFTPHIPAHAPQEEFEQKNVRIIRFPAWEIIEGFPIPAIWNPGFWKQWRKAKDFLPDITITRTRFFISSLFPLFPSLRSAAWLHIEHGSDFVRSSNRATSSIAKLYDYTFGALVLRRADHIVAISKESANFVARLSRRNATVIYRGVDQERILETSPEEENREPGTSRIVFTGRLMSGKGVQDLLHAIHRLKNAPPVHCTIIGDGPERTRLERQARQLGLADRVSFTGFLAKDNVIAKLKSSDIFVNPSYSEGLPTSVIEAALCKCAIIATNVGGTREIVTDQTSALLVPPGNIPALCGALQTLVQDKQLQESLRERAYHEVLPKFQWNRAIEQYTEIIRSLLV